MERDIAISRESGSRRGLAVALVAVGLGVVALAALALVFLLRKDDEAELRRMVSEGACPGYVTYTLEPGREDWSCVGWADAEAHRQMHARTVFRICSMTKSLVGALAAVLADRGTVDLDAPVSRTFPVLTGEKAGITLRQCLSMTAGFPEMSPSMVKRGVNGQSHETVVREMVGTPLVAKPGSRFVYSNPSFEIAAAVMVRATGKPLEELLAETFFRPLGMTETAFYPTEEMKSHMAVVYRLKEGGRYRRERRPLAVRPYAKQRNFASASGGLFSTPLDMMRFYKMLVRGGVAEDGRRVMTDGALSLITSKQTPTSVPTWYSFGFFLKDGWLGHGGAYSTLAEYDRKEGRLRMVFAQLSGPPVKDLIRLWRKVSDDSEDEVALTGSRHFED